MLKELYRKWVLRRRWGPRVQLERLRVIVAQDNRWMANDPIAAALTERYLEMLSDDWYERSSEDVSRLRHRLGIDYWVPRPEGQEFQPAQPGQIPLL